VGGTEENERELGERLDDGQGRTMLAVESQVNVCKAFLLVVDAEDGVGVHLVPDGLNSELLNENLLDRGDALAIPGVLAVDADAVGAAR